MTENKNMADGTVSPDAGKPTEVAGSPAVPIGTPDVTGRIRGDEPARRVIREEDGMEDPATASQPDENHLAKILEFRKPGTTFEMIEQDAYSMLDPNKSPDDIVNLARKMELTKANADELGNILRLSGVPADKVEIIVAKAKAAEEAGGLPEPELTENELTDVEKEELAKNKDEGGIDELQSLTSELAAKVASREEISPEEFEALEVRKNTIIEKVRDRFFGENGIFREGDRVQRLILRPLITLAITAAVIYISALSMLTSKAAQKFK